MAVACRFPLHPGGLGLCGYASGHEGPHASVEQLHLEGEKERERRMERILAAAGAPNDPPVVPTTTTYRALFFEDFLQFMELIPPDSKLVSARFVQMPRSGRRAVILETDKGWEEIPE